MPKQNKTGHGVEIQNRFQTTPTGSSQSSAAGLRPVSLPVLVTVCLGWLWYSVTSLLHGDTGFTDYPYSPAEPTSRVLLAMFINPTNYSRPPVTACVRVPTRHTSIRTRLSIVCECARAYIRRLHKNIRELNMRMNSIIIVVIIRRWFYFLTSNWRRTYLLCILYFTKSFCYASRIMMEQLAICVYRAELGT